MMLDEDLHDRLFDDAGVGVVLHPIGRVGAIDRERVAVRAEQVRLAESEALGRPALVDVVLPDLGAGVGVGQAECVADLVGGSRLKIVALPAG